MAGEILDILADDAADVFLTDFAETIRYKPGVAWPGRSILTVIDRNEPDTPGGMDMAPAPALIVYVANSATSGIGSEEINTGADTVVLKYRLDGADVEMRVRRMIAQDRGLLQLECGP